MKRRGQLNWFEARITNCSVLLKTHRLFAFNSSRVCLLDSRHCFLAKHIQESRMAVQKVCPQSLRTGGVNLLFSADDAVIVALFLLLLGAVQKTKMAHDADKTIKDRNADWKQAQSIL